MALEADLRAAVSPEARKNVAIALRQAVQAWNVARDAARVARNKPLPGSLRPESKPRAKAKPSSVSFQEAPAPITNTNASSPATPQSGPAT